MSYVKELCLGYSKLNLPWCRKRFIWILIILGVILSGCEKEESSVENNDVYYVKYIVDKSTPYSLSITAQVFSENGVIRNFTFSNSDWEMTVGPFVKGIRVSIDASYDTSQTHARTYIDVEIHVSINNGPFVLKASDISDEVRLSASTSYRLN